MNVLGYARTSTLLQETSIKAQKTKIEKYCEMKSWKLEKVFIDEGKSGATQEREAWQELLVKLESGKYQGLVFTNFDRVARSLSDLLEIVDKLKKWNVNICSIDNNISTEGAQGRLMLQIIGAFAEFERNVIRQRLEEGLKRARLQGKPMGRKPKKPNKERVIELYKLGLSPRKIALQFGISHSTMYKRIKEWGLM